MEQASIEFQNDLLKRYRRSAERSGETPVYLSLGEKVVRLLFAGGGLAGQLLPSLSGVLDNKPCAEPDITLYLWQDADFFECHPAVSGLRQYPDKVSVSNNASAHLQYNPEGDIFSFIDTGADSAFYCVADARRLPDYEIGTPMRMLFHWMCFKFGIAFVHAAAVGYAGRGALLIGRSGAGKSTTSLNCLLRGFDFAGDDYVAVTGGDRPKALSLYSGCKITDEMLPKLPALFDCLVKTNKTQNKNVAVITARQGNIVSSLPVSVLIRPRICHAPRTVFTGLAPAVLLMEAATSTVLQMQGGGDYTLRMIAGLCRSVPSYTAELGLDFSEITDSLKFFFENLPEGGDRA